MIQSDGILPHDDSVIMLWIQSDSNPWEWYLVDLEETGNPECPKGFCGCPYFEKLMSRIAKGSVRYQCKHIRRARDFIRARINAGELDSYL